MIHLILPLLHLVSYDEAKRRIMPTKSQREKEKVIKFPKNESRFRGKLFFKILRFFFKYYFYNRFVFPLALVCVPCLPLILLCFIKNNWDVCWMVVMCYKICGKKFQGWDNEHDSWGNELESCKGWIWWPLSLKKGDSILGCSTCLFPCLEWLFVQE